MATIGVNILLSLLDIVLVSVVGLAAIDDVCTDELFIVVVLSIYSIGVYDDVSITVSRELCDVVSTVNFVVAVSVGTGEFDGEGMFVDNRGIVSLVWVV